MSPDDAPLTAQTCRDKLYGAWIPLRKDEKSAAWPSLPSSDERINPFTKHRCFFYCIPTRRSFLVFFRDRRERESVHFDLEMAASRFILDRRGLETGEQLTLDEWRAEFCLVYFWDLRGLEARWPWERLLERPSQSTVIYALLCGSSWFPVGLPFFYVPNSAFALVGGALSITSQSLDAEPRARPVVAATDEKTAERNREKKRRARVTDTQGKLKRGPKPKKPSGEDLTESDSEEPSSQIQSSSGEPPSSRKRTRSSSSLPPPAAATPPSLLPTTCSTCGTSLSSIASELDTSTGELRCAPCSSDVQDAVWSAASRSARSGRPLRLPDGVSPHSAAVADAVLHFRAHPPLASDPGGGVASSDE